MCVHCWISYCSYILGKSGPALYSGCLGIHICSVEAVLFLHFVKVSLLVLAGLGQGHVEVKRTCSEGGVCVDSEC